MQKLLAWLGLRRSAAKAETVEEILEAANAALKKGEEILAAYQRTQGVPDLARHSLTNK
jgi:hypothetical protein